jgi:hypothetical protein
LTSQPTLVVNRRYEDFDVYIGRPSKWANPFSHVPSKFTVMLVATRDEAVRRHAEWILTQPQLLACLHELRGKRLGCWCDPLP